MDLTNDNSTNSRLDHLEHILSDYPCFSGMGQTFVSGSISGSSAVQGVCSAIRDGPADPLECRIPPILRRGQASVFPHLVVHAHQKLGVSDVIFGSGNMTITLHRISSMSDYRMRIDRILATYAAVRSGWMSTQDTVLPEARLESIRQKT